MKITNHVLLRYVQRVLGIKNEKAAIQYLEINDIDVYKKVVNLSSHCYPLHLNLPKDLNNPRSEFRDIYVHTNLYMKHTLLVASANSKELITLWRFEANEENREEAMYKVLENNKLIKQQIELKKKQDRKARDAENISDWVLENERFFTAKLYEEAKESVNLETQAQIETARKITYHLGELKRENRELMALIMYNKEETPINFELTANKTKEQLA